MWPAGTLRLKPRHSRTEFWLECHYPDPVTAGVRLLGLAFDRATVATGLFQQGLCVGMQQTTLGAWAPDLSTPLPLPAGFAATLSRHVLPAENLPPTGLPSTSLPPDAVKRRFYPVEATFSARYGDFDADGCTSEAAVLRGIEQARAAVLQTAIAAAGGNAEQDWVNLLVARIDLHWAHHRAPPKTWALAGAVLSVGRSSVLLRVAMFDGERLHAMADNVMVYVAPVVATPPAALEPAAELAAAAPTAREPLPPPLRDALQALAWRGR